MLLDIMDTLNRLGNQLQHWFLNQYENPLFWLLLFVGLTLVVMLAYGYLHKR